MFFFNLHNPIFPLLKKIIINNYKKSETSLQNKNTSSYEMSLTHNWMQQEAGIIIIRTRMRVTKILNARKEKMREYCIKSILSHNKKGHKSSRDSFC